MDFGISEIIEEMMSKQAKGLDKMVIDYINNSFSKLGLVLDVDRFE